MIKKRERKDFREERGRGTPERSKRYRRCLQKLLYGLSGKRAGCAAAILDSGRRRCVRAHETFVPFPTANAALRDAAQVNFRRAGTPPARNSRVPASGTQGFGLRGFWLLA